MREASRAAATLLGLITLLTGVAYPMLVTGLCQLLFPIEANGSVLVIDGRAQGSTLVGQAFTGPGYLHPRPSATSGFPYNAGASGGSQLGPTSGALASLVRRRVAEARTREGLADDILLPVDLVTASGSGLDPHVSPAAAALQVGRIARVRGMAPEAVGGILAQATSPRWLGVVGEARVNVLVVNLLLDGALAQAPSLR